MERKKWISNYNHSNGNDIKYIVMHDTGNYKDSARNNASYFNECNRNASAHYFVDDKGYYQVVEDYNAAWHCGDGHGKNGISNHNSMGIEMCNSGGYISEETIKNALILVKEKQAQYGIPDSKVVRHYDASGKNCPANMSANGWAKWKEFKSRLSGTTTKANTSSLDGHIGIVTTRSSNLIVRSKPSKDGEVLGSLSKGSRIKIFKDCGNGWYSVYYGSHGGYVSKDYISLT